MDRDDVASTATHANTTPAYDVDPADPIATTLGPAALRELAEFGEERAGRGG